MSYPFSWTPRTVIPTDLTQITVFDSNGALAVFDVNIALSPTGNITFELDRPGRYRIVIRDGLRVETGIFYAVTEGVLLEPGWVTYEVYSSDQLNDLSNNPVYNTNVSTATFTQAIADQKAFAIAMAIAL